MDLSSIKLDLFKKTLHSRLSNIHSESDYGNIISTFTNNSPTVSNTWGTTEYKKGKGFRNGHFLNFEYNFKTKNSARIAKELLLEMSTITGEEKGIQIEQSDEGHKINISFHNNDVVRPENIKRRKEIEGTSNQKIQDYKRTIQQIAFLTMIRMGMLTLHDNKSIKKTLDKKDINNALDRDRVNTRDDFGNCYQNGISMFVAHGYSFYNQKFNNYIKKRDPELFQMLKSESTDIIKMAFKQHPEQKSLFIKKKLDSHKETSKSITEKLKNIKSKNSI
mgnify:CR=1 FL=1